MRDLLSDEQKAVFDEHDAKFQAHMLTWSQEELVKFIDWKIDGRAENDRLDLLPVICFETLIDDALQIKIVRRFHTVELDDPTYGEARAYCSTSYDGADPMLGGSVLREFVYGVEGPDLHWQSFTIGRLDNASHPHDSYVPDVTPDPEYWTVTVMNRFDDDAGNDPIFETTQIGGCMSLESAMSCLREAMFHFDSDLADTRGGTRREVSTTITAPVRK